jgi:hypothetical protein
MFARSLAVFGCFLISALGFAAEPVISPAQKVVVYLRGAAGQSTESVKEMKREAAALLGRAGYSLTWRNVGQPAVDTGDAPTIVLELDGRCQAPEPTAQTAPLSKAESLGTTAVSGGVVLPFNYVDCDTLSRLLMPGLVSFGSRRDTAYGRAMGRVAAHELFHALAKTTDHEESGAAKASFSANDLLDPQLRFDAPTVARLENAPPDSDESDDDSASISGR